MPHRRTLRAPLCVVLAFGAALTACATGELSRADATAPSDAPGAESFAPDTVPLADGAASDAGPRDEGLDAGPHHWAFNGYCGAAVDAGCPALPACPTFAGGVSARACDAPRGGCVAAEAAGLASRVYACIPAGSSVWALNGLCTMMDCTGLDAAVCPGAPGGVACTPDLSRCAVSGAVYACLPGGAPVWVFDGYCGTTGTAACETTLPTCTAVGSGTAGAPCSAPFSRCLGGNKLFICAAR